MVLLYGTGSLEYLNLVRETAKPVQVIFYKVHLNVSIQLGLQQALRVM